MWVSSIKNFLRPSFKRSYIKLFVKCHRSAKLFHADRLDIGEYVYIGPNCMVNAQGGVRIGEGTILGPEVVILSSNHDYSRGQTLPYDLYDRQQPVQIGAGVWIGYRAMICPGVKIGDGAIVAMGSVVTKNVGVGVIVGGNPASKISERCRERVIQLTKESAYFHKRYWSVPRPRVHTADD